MGLNLTGCEQIHNRNIDITTYAFEQDAVAIEGRLFDNRTNVSYNMFGEPRDPGPVHDLIVRMVLRLPTLVIEAVEVEMVTVPYDGCPAVLESLRSIQRRKAAAKVEGDLPTAEEAAIQTQ